jgi:hypothetical protein
VNGTTIPAPGGEGVLAYSNANGSGEAFDTLEWYTREGKRQSMESSGFRGWIPGTHKSLFATSAENTDQFRLVDWDTGKTLWMIPCPSKGPLLATGITPKFIIFSAAEPWQFGSNGTISPGVLTRTFYAVNAQDGSLAASWLPQKWSHPRPYAGDGGDYFLWNGKTLYYMMTDDFLAIDPAEIENKKNGWK